MYSTRYLQVLFITILSSEATAAGRAADIPIPVALYPLNGQYGTSDISPNKNPPGIPSGIHLAPGPYGHPKGSYQFSGTSSSYIELPNNGGLDTRYSVTVLAWVNPENDEGPLFHYGPNSCKSVHVWVGSRGLYVRPMTRTNKPLEPLEAVSTWELPKSWQYVGTTYDFFSGVVRLWVNGKEVAQAAVGSNELSTQYDVRVGAKTSTDDTRYFKGHICCIQVYNKALSEQEIVAVQNRTVKTDYEESYIYIFGQFQPALSPQQQTGHPLATFKSSNVIECLLRCSRMSDCNSVAIDGISRERSNRLHCQLYEVKFDASSGHRDISSDKQYYSKANMI